MGHVLHLCRRCGREIVWLTTEKGRSIPVEPASVDPDDLPIFMPSRHRAHAPACPGQLPFLPAHARARAESTDEHGPEPDPELARLVP